MSGVTGDTGGEMPRGRMRRKYRPSLGLILVVFNLTVLLLPIAGLVFFRISEVHVVRETESELIGQGALIAAMFKARARDAGGDIADAGRPIAEAVARPVDDYYRPVAPVTHLTRDEILPPRPDAMLSDVSADPLARRIGDELSPMLTEAQRTTLAGIRLLDHQGIVVGSTTPQPRFQVTSDRAAAPSSGSDIAMSFAHVPEVARALVSGRYTAALRQRISSKPQPTLTSLSRGARVRVFAVYPIVEGERLLGLVYLSRTPENVMHKLYYARDRVLLAAVLTVVLALALAALAGRLIARPIEALRVRARLLANGDPAGLAPIEQAGTRELADLSDSFFEMAQALKHRATYVRDFAAHVSHELKTPLTAIEGAVELIAEHGASMSDDERSRFLANITADTERLRRLVDRLHELARAEHAASVIETIDLAEALAALRDVHVSPSLAIGLDAEPGHLVRMSRESLGIVVANLVANAAQSGAGRIAIAVTAGGDEAIVTFADDGPGIPPEAAARIFEPFFTTRQSVGGTGLGLRIVRSIIESSAGSIELASATPGATFRITLPRANVFAAR